MTSKHELSRKLCRPKNGQLFVANGQQHKIARKIGNGAVGVVRAAKGMNSGTLRAVKFLAPDPKYIDPDAFEDVAVRFRREGDRGTSLDHFNLVKILSYEQNEGGSAFSSGSPNNPFVLMEYVNGRSLESHIKRAHPSLRGEFIVTEDSLIIAVQIVRALQYLHRRPVTHRDVKPANVFLSGSDEPRGIPIVAKLGDFGVVKWGDYQASISTGSLTMTSQKGLGTMKYMSPEQALMPKRVTVRSDIFSLGITLYELFTSQVLPSAHHVFNIMSARLSRGSVTTRYADLGIKLGFGDEDVAELILDMFLRGATGRPAAERVRGRLEWELDDRFHRRLPSG